MNEKIDLKGLCRLPYGMYIVSGAKEGKINAQIATVVFQVTNEPNQLATCLCKETLTHEYVMDGGHFGMMLLTESTDMKFIGRFGFRSGRDFNKFDGVNYVTKETGCPLVTDNTLVILEARVDHICDVGTHTLFAGELLSSEVVAHGPILTYDYYHMVKNGKSPKNAPTFQCKPSNE